LYKEFLFSINSHMCLVEKYDVFNDFKLVGSYSIVSGTHSVRIFDGLLYIGSSYSGQVQIIDIRAGFTRKLVVTSTGRINDILVFQDKLFCANNLPCISVFECKNQYLPQPNIYGHLNDITCLASYKHFLISGSNDGSVRFWDVNNNNRIVKSLLGMANHVYCIVVSGKNLYCGGKFNGIFVWDLSNNFASSKLIESKAENVLCLEKRTDYLFAGTIGSKILVMRVGEEVVVKKELQINEHPKKII